MAREHKNWNALVRSIRHNRAGNALFYKPVCVIAAIDLADIGRLDSDLLHSELIIRRFADYVVSSFPDRASNGWQPLWFLAKDGLWTFAKKGKLLAQTAFEPDKRPRSKDRVLGTFDTQAIAPAYRSLWEAAPSRKELRAQMLLLLADDPDSRVLIRPLFDPANLSVPENWPSETEIERYLQEVRDEGDLLQEDAGEPELTRAPRAVSAREALLRLDPRILPKATSVGPDLAVTGVAPVRLSPTSDIKVTQVQADLYQLLIHKCRDLQRLVTAESNRAAHVRPALDALILALGGRPEHANGYLVWSHGNTLRRLCDADLRSRRSQDPDTPPLPEQIGELLTDVVEQFNVYAGADQLFQTLDRARLGPAGRAELLKELEAGRVIVEAARETPGILADDTAEILSTATEVAEDAKHSSGINADQAMVNAVEMQRNSAGAILQNALLEVKNAFKKTKGAVKPLVEGALKQIGAEAVQSLPLARFVNGARDYFVALWQGKVGAGAVNQLIALIRDLFS